MTANPVEVSTRYATTVDTLADAWAFVMTRLDSVGPDPSIKVSPLWIFTPGDQDPPRRFSVVVEGMVHEQKPTS